MTSMRASLERRLKLPCSARVSKATQGSNLSALVLKKRVFAERLRGQDAINGLACNSELMEHGTLRADLRRLTS